MSKIGIFKPDERQRETNTILSMLQVQLNHSVIELEGHGEDGACPVIYPEPSLRFMDFASTLGKTEELHYELAVFRLASALFDEVDLKLNEDTPRDIVENVIRLRRKNNVANWIRWYVDDVVRNEARSQIASPNHNSGERIIFSYLSGGFFEEACRQALEMGNVRLATLLAQANGGGNDDEFRLDLLDQLSVWRTGGTDALISPEYRRVIELLSGSLTISKGNGKRDETERVDDLAIATGLDWVRTFSLFLHFDQRFEAGIEDSVNAYEASIGQGEGDDVIVPPLPPHVERDLKPGSKRFRDVLRKGTYPSDVVFAMLKLFSQRDYPLEGLLDPRQYGPSSCNFGLAFHLAQLLSRVLGVRDFGDRIDLGIDGEALARLENWRGNSAGHDNLCVHYAMQLEVVGLWTWSAFVLLHLELRESRKASLVALLARNVTKLSAERGGEDGQERNAAEAFLVDTLKVPVEWIHEARADAAGYCQDRFAEYEHLMRAHQYGRAHEVAICFLAPEGMIRHDFALILDLFTPFRKSAIAPAEDDADQEMATADTMAADMIEVPGWQAGGQVYLDYIAACRSLPWLVATHAPSLVAALDSELRSNKSQINTEETIALISDTMGPEAAAVARRIEGMAAKIPRLVQRVNELFDGIVGARGQPTTITVARSQMVASLHNCVRSLKATRTLCRLATYLPSLDVELGDGKVESTVDSAPSGGPPVEVENLHFMANAYCAALVEGSA